jgi:flagellar hook assembly protein FlgD
VKKIFLKIFLIPFLFINVCFAQNIKKDKQINWTGIKNEKINATDSISFLTFEDGIFENLTIKAPFIVVKEEITDSEFQPDFILSDFIFEELAEDERQLIPTNLITNNIVQKEVKITYDKKIPYAILKINPFRINPVTNKLEKIISFSYKLVFSDKALINSMKNHVYANNSNLSSGNWYKFSVKQTGLFRIGYNDLINMGINVNSLNPQNIAIFGNPAGMLPEANSADQYDDINELAIIVADGNDGKFDANDYILFYGQSPVVWKYNSSRVLFEHQINYYADQTYYFLTTDQNIGIKKRISLQTEPSNSAAFQINSFVDYAFYHKELENLAKSGKIWVGERFDNIIYNYNYPFNFPDLISDSNLYLKYSLLASSPAISKFILNLNGNTKVIEFNSLISSTSGTLALNKVDYLVLNNINNPINININYDHPLSTSKAWLNYLEMNVYRQLKFNGSQLSFRTSEGYGSGNISQFNISNSNSTVNVLDVTDPLNVRFIDKKLNGNTLSFKISTDTLKEFIAYNGASFLTPTYIGVVANQNLHGLSQHDYIIVSHPLFLNEANRLAKLHEDINQLKVKVVTPEIIYNEFSSGSQDPMAIRNFMKMFYDRATNANEMPKYLLFFGDGSYDYKNRIADNSNFIVTYESDASFEGSMSYASDDFFGFLDDNENGTSSWESLDLGIGRFPVKTLAEAQTIVNKIYRYSSKTDLVQNSNTTISNFSDWRNTVCFVADDEDGNVYLKDTELIYTKLKNSHPAINSDKIYLDAYPQVSNAGGQRYPDVNEAINQRVEKGALIVNYIGHGGELGWAHERVLEISDILKWKNRNNMPLFFTATCEFSRFDDPERTSAGELVILNENGGGIALLTTSRLAYQSPNMALNNSFFNRVFVKTNGKYPTMGDLMRYSKNDASNNYAIKNFVLLGDPALKLSYPKYNVLTTHINNKSVSAVSDTIQAMSTVTIKGIVTDENMNKINYNGVLFPTIYDKPMLVNSLANDPASSHINFELPKAILYKGKASIINGDFEFSFIVPRDIAYYYGYGKISYYAKNDSSDANGFYSNIVVGSFDPSVIPDVTGPEIKLYMNDTNFIFKGITDENPILLAKISDLNGINTVGNGIGHDIVAYFDGNETKPIILNDYYVSDIDEYNKGSVYYPFFELNEGLHSIKVKVWDVFNNSTESYTEFIVSKSAQLALNNVLNYPNPFLESTNFVFEHNQPDSELDIQIEIYDMNGKNLKTISQKIISGGYKIEPINWNGTTDSGDKIGKGIYIYRLIVSKQNGDQVVKSNKLVFLR